MDVWSTNSIATRRRLSSNLYGHTTNIHITRMLSYRAICSPKMLHSSLEWDWVCSRYERSCFNATRTKLISWNFDNHAQSHAKLWSGRYILSRNARPQTRFLHIYATLKEILAHLTVLKTTPNEIHTLTLRVRVVLNNLWKISSTSVCSNLGYLLGRRT